AVARAAGPADPPRKVQRSRLFGRSSRTWGQTAAGVRTVGGRHVGQTEPTAEEKMADVLPANAKCGAAHQNTRRGNIGDLVPSLTIPRRWRRRIRSARGPTFSPI